MVLTISSEHTGDYGAYKKAFKETATGKGDVPAGFVAMTPFTADSGAKVSLEEDSIGLLISYVLSKQKPK